MYPHWTLSKSVILRFLAVKKPDVILQMQGRQKCQSLIAIVWGFQSSLRQVEVYSPATAFQGEEGWTSLST